MVFVMPGMQLRLPEGGLILTLDDDPPPVAVEVRVDTWPHWLREAVAGVERSAAAHAELLAAHASSQPALVSRALELEFQHAMVSMSSAAFALDAFYATVTGLVALPIDLREAWRRNRTSRAVRIAETLRRSFDLGDHDTNLRLTVLELFKWRDFAVHPPAGYRQPITHPDLGAGVEWRYVGFTAEGCASASHAALAMLQLCLGRPKAKHRELVDWAAVGTALIRPIVEDWVRRYGSDSD